VGRLEHAFPGHVDAVWAVAFDAHGERLASASSDGMAKLWSARWSRSVRSFSVPLDVNRVLEGRGDTFAAIHGDGSSSPAGRRDRAEHYAVSLDPAVPLRK
jgi:WD40 repeat protein